MHISFRERLLAGLGTAIIVALLGTLLLLGLTVKLGVGADRPLALLDLPAPRPPAVTKPPVERPTTRHASGKASPRNLRNKATPIVAPPPIIRLPPSPPPLILAPKPGLGAAPSAGASDRPGPGEGAGGQGDGTGNGEDGDGEGDGGDIPPRLIKGRLRFSDLPPDLRDGNGGTVAVRYHVGIDGRVDRCMVTVSSGSSELDGLTCRLIQQRFRYDPSRDDRGRPVTSIIVENHSWSIDRSEEETPPRH